MSHILEFFSKLITDCLTALNSASAIDFSLDESILDNNDIESLLTGDRNTKLLLDTFSPMDIEVKMEKQGILQILHGKGYDNLRCILDTTDPFVHRFVVTDDLLLHLAYGPKNRNGIILHENKSATKRN